MKTLNLLALLALGLVLSLSSLSCGCGDDDDDDDSDDGADDDTGDDDTGDDDTGDDDAVDDDDATDDDATDDDATDDDDTTELFNIDFEDYALGDLPLPWEVTEEGNSYIEVVEDPTEKSGLVMDMAGASGLGNQASAKYSFNHSSDLFFFSYEEYVRQDTWIHVSLNEDALKMAFQVSFNPNVGQLMVDYDTNYGNCGTYSINTWYTILLEVDVAAQTVTVRVNGVLSDCVDIPFNPNITIEAINYFSVNDYAGADESGWVNFDNFIGYE